MSSFPTSTNLRIGPKASPICFSRRLQCLRIRDVHVGFVTAKT